MKMAQPPPDQNLYHPHLHANPHPQLHLPPQFRNSFDLLFDERTGAINYNYIRPYISNQIQKRDDLSESLVMRRPRRTRTTFTNAQIAVLEQSFVQGRYLTSAKLAELSAKLALGTAQVKIWFKNRRRRQKIQSNQPKEFPCDVMPLSPTTAVNSVNTEPNKTASSCGSSSSGSSSSSSSSGGQTDYQSLSLNGSCGSTPNTLTPSPTPTTTTANLVTHYGETAFNPYYYNNHHASHPSQHHQTHPTHVSLTNPYAAARTQYYPPPAPPGTLQHHQHQQQYHAAHPHQFSMQHKTQAASIKQKPEYNYDNPYYMPMPTLLAVNTAATSLHPTSKMPPNSEDYKPLTPKDDENSSLCNGAGNGHGDPVDDSNDSETKLLVLGSNNANSNGETCSSGNPIVTDSCANSIDDCNGSFSKFQKMACYTNDPNYQCTIDTLMHAYNNHRNSSTNTQQLATYCFN